MGPIPMWRAARPRRLFGHLLLLGAACILWLSPPAAGVSITLNSSALGLGGDKINDGDTVDPDVTGSLWTSTNIGEGSVLNIQFSGVAGPGTTGDPLLVMVTARTHTDAIYNLPAAPHDYFAGILYISKDEKDLKNEGMGVRAFNVDATTGLRLYDSENGRAEIDGSKEISGSDEEKNLYFMDGPKPRKNDPNGPPHEDEAVIFDFTVGASRPSATQMDVLLTKFKRGKDEDGFVLELKLTTGDILDFSSLLGECDAALSEQPDKEVYLLDFGGLAGLDVDDLLDSFTIRSVGDGDGKKQHFLINGFTTFDVPFTKSPSVVPEPLTMLGCAMGLASLGAYLRKRRGPRRAA